MKNLACKLRDHCIMICVDDKSIVPNGNQNGQYLPECALTIRHLFQYTDLLWLPWIMTSVMQIVKIPESPADSFYDSKLVITVKDKIKDKSIKCLQACCRVNPPSS
jgi:hypothetical protein